MLSLIMLQAAAAGLSQLGAAIGAGLAAIGAGIGIGKSVVLPWKPSVANRKQPATSV